LFEVVKDKIYAGYLKFKDLKGWAASGEFE